MQEYSLRDEVEWGIAHGFLANMGRWQLKFMGNLAVATRGLVEGLETIEELPKPVDGREKPDKIREITRAVSMPNPIPTSSMVKSQIKHQDTDTTVLHQTPSPQRALTRIVTQIAHHRLTNNLGGQRMLSLS